MPAVIAFPSTVLGRGKLGARFDFIFESGLTTEPFQLFNGVVAHASPLDVQGTSESGDLRGAVLLEDLVEGLAAGYEGKPAALPRVELAGVPEVGPLLSALLEGRATGIRSVDALGDGIFDHDAQVGESHR